MGDPEFYKPQKIDMLRVADIFVDLLSAGQIKQGPEFLLYKKLISIGLFRKYVRIFQILIATDNL